eukprot:TRINITY_DN69040_c0_g1_i1.p1 TRINITY_DN69040_c0_g1~~TRINITY_DN69040_c0_g1_i1.p1  ORF type:complete len:186 (-),score=28.94 TRINITY_DN69040_c0_g1_i1:27-533(-)
MVLHLWSLFICSVGLVLLPFASCETLEVHADASASATSEAAAQMQARLVRAQARVLARREEQRKWWYPRSPFDETQPQPKSNTGTINPLSCYDTVNKEDNVCMDFATVACQPWTIKECQCSSEFPICVKDIHWRSSPMSPADSRSATENQYACCPRPVAAAEDGSDQD